MYKKNKGCHIYIVAFVAIYIKKKYLKAKRRNPMEGDSIKYFTMQKHSLQKILYKKPKSFQILLLLLTL